MRGFERYCTEKITEAKLKLPVAFDCGVSVYNSHFLGTETLNSKSEADKIMPMAARSVQPKGWFSSLSQNHTSDES